jgi:F-type H+-transporting ATPase subunit epsilon
MTQAPNRCVDVEIADVSRLIFTGSCTKVVAPAALGEVCILFGHAPLLTRLSPGEIRVRTEDGQDEIYFVSGGFMEVQRTRVTVLADQMLRSEEIDEDAALAAKRHAESILKRNPLFRDRDEAHLQLIKAIAQLRVLEHAERLHLRKPYR